MNNKNDLHKLVVAISVPPIMHNYLFTWNGPISTFYFFWSTLLIKGQIDRTSIMQENKSREIKHCYWTRSQILAVIICVKD